MFSPFTLANSSAQNLTGLHVVAGTDGGGGAGSASAGASLRLFYNITNNPTNALLPLTFEFDLSGLMFLTSLQPGTVAAVLNADVTVGSDAGSATSNGGLELVSHDGGAPTLQNIHLLTLNAGADINRPGVTGDFAVTVQARQFVILDFDLSISVEGNGGDTFDDISMSFGGATLPASFGGPLPVLTNPGEANVPVSLAPEPATAGLALFGVATGAMVRRRRQTRI
jgi:MYXO-CTERM domain-containing protein